jgi:hypothetical protein
LRPPAAQRTWAKRLGVSIPTLIRMERGDPGVGMGVYVTVLWLIGRSSALADLAAPESDRGALERDVRGHCQACSPICGISAGPSRAQANQS